VAVDIHGGYTSYHPYRFQLSHGPWHTGNPFSRALLRRDRGVDWRLFEIAWEEKVTNSVLQTLTSRFSLLLLASSISGALCCVPVEPARAAAPGFFRMALGEFEVTALSDGVASLDVVKLLDEPADETEAALQSSSLHNPLDTSVNAYLIKTGSKLILVDAGGGTVFGPGLGKLRSNLQAAGYKPEQIDDIVLTHMHRDHIGGLTVDGKAIFPNATVHADKRESDFWLSSDNLNNAPPDKKARFLGVSTALQPYIAAGRYKPFETDAEILPGVTSVASYGHTVGHTTYVVESGGQQLWLIGDLVNVAAVQLQHPAVSFAFDSIGPAAAASRVKFLNNAAEQGVLVGAAHLAFPGLGHFRAEGSGWQWKPVDPSVATH
jgi:glyoxylase-like metal-dependent hydrolase (beta-lactamase superfamily II)